MPVLPRSSNSRRVQFTVGLRAVYSDGLQKLPSKGYFLLILFLYESCHHATGSRPGLRPFDCDGWVSRVCCVSGQRFSNVIPTNNPLPNRAAAHHVITEHVNGWGVTGHWESGQSTSFLRVQGKGCAMLVSLSNISTYPPCLPTFPIPSPFDLNLNSSLSLSWTLKCIRPLHNILCIGRLIAPRTTFIFT